MRFLLAQLAAAGLLLISAGASPAPAASPAAPVPPPAFKCVPPSGEPLKGATLEAFCRGQQRRFEACAAQDGAWYVAGLSPPGTQPTCIVPTPDAGRACRSNSDCRQAACIPDDGAGTAAPGKALGHCDKYGLYSQACFQSVESGRILTPPPCPVF